MAIRVLIADDHAVVREGLRLILQLGMGIDVVGEAANGREALQLAHSLRPDVVLLDITMPEMNGIEAAERLAAELPQVRVLILSVHTTSEFVYRALRAGAQGYVLKECAGHEVVAAVRKVADGGRYLSQAIAHLVICEAYQHAPALPVPSPLDSLSAREREVLQLVVEGSSSAAIARRICLSPKTVETYRCRLMRKLGVHDLPGLVKFAVQHGLTPGG